ncbi:hypothetical protein C8F04DRAFT_1088471 [Mycena alexandri]|uniref:Uncharacterized protein n=1 Tax=Mycena alexandri TaxID=1745969 RepID=A0AAD6T321_9AGAR|nr:hypothetical protein C8F04DRAFT_1088471 [Mycena alexandri]
MEREAEMISDPGCGTCLSSLNGTPCSPSSSTARKVRVSLLLALLPTLTLSLSSPAIVSVASRTRVESRSWRSLLIATGSTVASSAMVDSPWSLQSTICSTGISGTNRGRAFLERERRPRGTPVGRDQFTSLRVRTCFDLALGLRGSTWV